MKRRLQSLLLCLTLCLLLSGCHTPMVNPLVESAATTVPGTDPVLPAARDDTLVQLHGDATLYFRYMDEPFLAAETRTVTQQPNQPYELALVQELIAGPGTRSSELHSLFPSGARVLSSVRQGRTVFITLSGEIMNGYSDEPSAWQNDPAWQVELPLRRQLCMQSIVATITENCDVDQVQILVEDGSILSGSMRLQKRYFQQDPSDLTLVGPMTRDATLLLEPDTTLSVLMDCWSMQDWQRMYRYIAARDPQTREERPELRDFISMMESAHAMVDWSSYGGSVGPSGVVMTYAIDLVMRDADGYEYEATGRILRLYRDSDVWKVTMSQLTGWLEE